MSAVPSSPKTDFDSGSVTGYSTPPRQDSPRREQVSVIVSRWLRSVYFYAASGSIDDVKIIRDLAKRMPDVSRSVKSAMDLISNGGLNCDALCQAVAREMLQLGMRQELPDNQVRSRSPSDLH